LIDKAKMTQSMSRAGRCIDNGPMESFWGKLKSEKYYLHTFETFEDLSHVIDEYIRFYNHKRYQKRLNGLRPMEYRVKATLIIFIISTVYLTGDSSEPCVFYSILIVFLH
jgi:putative transposase